MGIKSTRFVRKPFVVDAIQVTEKNMVEAAEWCNGDIHSDNKYTDTEAKYVRVRVTRPQGERHTRAYAGDWILYAGTGYKVYTNRAFKETFDKAPEAA